jgi:hypothetical protein
MSIKSKKILLAGIMILAVSLLAIRVSSNKQDIPNIPDVTVENPGDELPTKGFDGTIWTERIGSYVEVVWNEGRDVLIRGTNKYLNFGNFSGSSGYGFRDSGGTIQWKNSGGSWANISAGGAGSQTPWEQNIVADGYNLSGVGQATGTSATFDIFTGYFSGNLGGTASTSQALAANGANCTAGSTPLGVDASGAVEGCFDVWTEAENTSAGYLTALSPWTSNIVADNYNLSGFGTATGTTLTVSGTTTTTGFAITNSPSYDGVLARINTRWLQFGPTYYPANYVTDCDNCSYLVMDKDAEADDTSIVFRDQGNARAEIGLIGDNKLHFKTVTGSFGSESFTDAMVLTAGRLGIATSTPQYALDVVGSIQGTNLRTKGDNGALVMTADTDGGDYNIYSSNGNQTLALYGSAGNVLNVSLLDGNLTVASGLLDVSGGSLEIPNGTGPTVDATGELAFDTTDNELVVYDGSAVRAIRTTQKIMSFTMASTSPYWTSGKSVPAPPEIDDYTVTALRCFVDSGTSKVVTFTDGTNDMDSMTCGTTLTSDDGSIANNTVTAGELMYFDMGADTGTVDAVTFSVYGYYARD